MKLLNIMLSLSLSLSALAATKSYEIKSEKSKVGFEIFKFKISSPVFGEFKKFDGSFSYDESKKTLSNIAVTIDASSVDTQEEKRDKHLRSADFFDVDNHKALVFKSAKPVVLKNGKAKIKGTLTMRGKTKEVELDVELKDTKDGLHFVGKTKVDRNDFGISWNSTFSVADISKNVLGDEVKIDIEVYSSQKKNKT